MDLIVLSPFDGYEHGDRITDPALVENLKGREGHVVRVASMPDAVASPAHDGEA